MSTGSSDPTPNANQPTASDGSVSQRPKSPELLNASQLSCVTNGSVAALMVPTPADALAATPMIHVKDEHDLTFRAEHADGGEDTFKGISAHESSLAVSSHARVSNLRRGEWARDGSAASMGVSTASAASHRRGSFKGGPLHPNGTQDGADHLTAAQQQLGLWMAVRIYIRIRLHVRHWKARRERRTSELNGGAKVDIVNDAVTTADSSEWIHVFPLDECLVTPYQPAFGASMLHLSRSHVYVVSQDLIDRSVLFRLGDIHEIVPLDVGVQFTIAPPNRLLEGNDFTDEEKSVVEVHLPDLTFLALHVFELQSKYLRGFSARIAKALRIKTKRVLHIVHFNDVYHLPPFKPATARGIVGGASRFHTLLARIREEHNPLVLFSGDFMGPSLMSVITKGKQMIDALNFLGVHYGVFGNHEFDFGLKTLKDAVHGFTHGHHIFPGSQTTWLMSNMIEPVSQKPLGGVAQSAMCVWNGVAVGLLGLCENWLPTCPQLASEEAQYLDIYETGERLARDLKEKGAEIVIAITHNRNDVDREIGVRCPSIDFNFGGHDHKSKIDLEHRYLKSGQEFEFLTFVEMEIGDKRINKVRVDQRAVTYDTPQSDYMKGLIERYNQKVDEKLGKPIGLSPIALDSTEECVRFKEGQLTNFILDIIQQESGADIAVLGAAAFGGKEVKPPGNITLGDVFNWFPNETKIMTMALKGSTIKKMLDVMVKEVPAEAPSFPHPSANLSFTISSMKRPPCCEDICIRGLPIEPDREYIVAVEEFAGLGKAKYKFVPVEGRVCIGDEQAAQLVNWVMDYFVKRKGQDNGPESIARQNALKQVSKVVSSATRMEMNNDMQKSQKFVRSLICQLMQCDRASVFLLEGDFLSFIPDGKTDEVRFPKTVGLAGACATSRTILNIKDVYEDPRFNQAVDKATGYRTKSMLACPITLDGNTCIAVVQAINKNPAINEGFFDDLDETLLQLLGEQVGFQLKNASIYQDIMAKNAETVSNGGVEFLSFTSIDVYKQVASDVALEILTASASLTSSANELIPVERFDIYVVGLPGPTGASELRLYVDNVDEEPVMQKVDPPVTGPTMWVVQQAALEKKQIFVSDASKHTVGASDAGGSFKARQAIVTPLVTGEGTVIAVIVWNNRRRPMKAFSEADLVAAEYFGRFAAVSIQNTLRIESLNMLRQECVLQQVPTVFLGRIRRKDGWKTVRRRLLEIIEMGEESESDAAALDEALTVNASSVRGPVNGRRRSALKDSTSLPTASEFFNMLIRSGAKEKGTRLA